MAPAPACVSVAGRSRDRRDGFAKPARAEEVASKGGVVMLAIDTSLSMEANDVSPSRIDAAKAAATSFLKSLPDGVRVGVVGFDGSSHILLDPTSDGAAVQRTIDRLQLGEGTAIGEAVFSALEAINTPDPAATDGGSAPSTTAPKPEDGKLTGAIVLLSDGETTEGRPNDEAAKAATAAGVVVNTIAFGTDSGVVTGPDGSQIPVPVNRDALRTLADQTGGTYSVRVDRGSAQAGVREARAVRRAGDGASRDHRLVHLRRHGARGHGRHRFADLVQPAALTRHSLGAHGRRGPHDHRRRDRRVERRDDARLPPCGGARGRRRLPSWAHGSTGRGARSTDPRSSARCVRSRRR